MEGAKKAEKKRFREFAETLFEIIKDEPQCKITSLDEALKLLEEKEERIKFLEMQLEKREKMINMPEIA